MKKRLTCLFLCLVMMLSVLLTACGEQTDEEVQDEIQEAASKNTMTLTMWVVSEEKVDSEIAERVNEEITKLTEAKYKTKLVIKYFTEDEYYDQLMDAIAEYENVKATSLINTEQQTEAETEAATEAEDNVEVDADGMLRDRYPALEGDYQVDIIYIGDLKNKDGSLQISGETLFNELVAGGYLAELDKDIKGDSKKIQEYISPTLLSSVKKNGVTYAVPNNNVIGEYTYMLLNESLMNRYSMQGQLLNGTIDSFCNDAVYQFLNMIAEYTDGSVLPIDATYQECLELLAYYWSINPDDYSIDGSDFSIFGSVYEDLAAFSRGETALNVENLLENPAFTKAFLQLNKYRLNESGRDFFRSEANAETAYEQTAIKFLKGDLTLLTQENGVSYYTDENGVRYYAVPVKYPTASSDDIYSNMFGICSLYDTYKLSDKVTRCMQIITYFNTNEEARNLLQYGVEGEHYDLIKETDPETNATTYTAVSKKTTEGKQYKMDLYATGNAFLAYLTPEMNKNIWESGKMQNRSSLVDPLLGFDLTSFAASVTTIGNDVVIPTEGDKPKYELSYSSGYSKDVLSQNKALKNWIDTCDKAEKGVFIYKSFIDDAATSTLKGTFYVYNTLGSADFSITPNPIITESFDTNGGVSNKETGMNLILNYDNLKEGGYELSVFTYSGSGGKVYTNTFTTMVEGEAVAVKDSAQLGSLSFDFENTKYYNVNIYGDLNAAYFYENDYVYKTVTDWILDVDITSEHMNVLSWVDTESSASENYHTYVFLRRNIRYITDLDVNIRGGEKDLVLNLEYTSPEYGADTKDEDKIKFNDVVTTKNEAYLLYYVTVAADKDVSVSYNINLNGKADTTPIDKAEGTPGTELDVYGELNTELIAYTEQLSDAVVEVLNACTTYDELVAVVNDLKILLSTTKQASAKDLQTDAVKALASGEIIDDDYATLYYQVRHIINRDPMNEVEKNANESWTEESLKGIREKRIYYYSPFGIYYQWLNEYAYLPAAN
ncbi:MAG: hypothetical protein IJX80_07590 [Clostridia bacterium]|nr:hypothetical protein [Clostridia bacterium]